MAVVVFDASAPLVVARVLIRSALIILHFSFFCKEICITFSELLMFTLLQLRAIANNLTYM